ncbi:GNAT family protein [Yoonia sp. SS1-5]|uniref:GNAT family protein n=1 Tax=Yoonia rhodophyticola TaxID=3137370 RepID=A0AAN0M866_9RHOB
MTATVLRTERLVLRPPAPRNARVIARAVNNINVSRWLTRVPFPYGITDAQWFVSENQAGRFNARLIWADDIFVGTIGLDQELGYWLAQAAWGRGYATEAARAVLDDHFADGTADLVKSSHFAENTASRNVLDKLGFVDVGPCTHFSKARNAPVPGRSMELTRSRWEQAR